MFASVNGSQMTDSGIFHQGPHKGSVVYILGFLWALADVTLEERTCVVGIHCDSVDMMVPVE